MLDKTVFDSRNLACKTPFGAVTLQQKVSFTLRPHTADNFVECVLVTAEDFTGDYRETPLAKGVQEGDRTLFSGTLTAPAVPALIWYRFRFKKADGSIVWLGKYGYRPEHEAASWQLTVYDGSRKTPDWFGRGTTYQIFPDRFCRTAVPDPTGMIGDRVVHQGWDERMEYLPDKNGEILNRDFYGGNIRGIIEKLDYLESLGVSTIYFCPIFEASSNHRYNTADYGKIDPMLGTEADFKELCDKAHERNIRIMLDGVFNHTGHDSIYFNAKGYYPSLGAAQSKNSPYVDWYQFKNWPNDYESWWGIHTLPSVNESHPDYIDYIIENENSIVRRWLRMGADAWRLDVADELPDFFIEKIRTVMSEEKEDSFLLGEVWEDGSYKIAYGQRRRYLLGSETDGLMNYPFRTAAMNYLQGGDAADFVEAMETLRENYPPAAFYSCMNLLGTHDTPRILTTLGAPPKDSLPDRTQRAYFRMSDGERAFAVRRLMVGALLLYAFPGSPTVYYGDEAGMEGYEDPFNRGTFPWGNEDPVLLRHFRLLGQLRKGRHSLQMGDIVYHYCSGHGLAFSRTYEGETTLVALNTGDDPITMELPWTGRFAIDPIDKQQFNAQTGFLRITIPPLDGLLLI